MKKLFKPNLTENELQRIFNKTTISDNGCWIWNGAKIKNRGYGVLNFRGKTFSIHRLLYADIIEPIPYGTKNGKNVLDHIVCDNPACINPYHLKLTNQKRNVLRGSNPTAINARKTHCIRGHKLPEKPNEKWGDGRQGRRCVICRRENARKRYLKKKG